MNELIQHILTYTILAAAAGYAVYSAAKAIFPKKEELQPGCGHGCGCDAVKMKKDLLLQKKLRAG